MPAMIVANRPCRIELGQSLTIPPPGCGRGPGKGVAGTHGAPSPDLSRKREGNVVTQYWLVKSEPDAFSWDQQVANGVEPWTGVRNHSAKLT